MLRPRDPEREAGRLLTEIYRAHAAGAYRYAYHLTRSREDADDIVQTVFLGLHQSLLRGATIVSPSAFLATAVKRRAINLAARHRAEPDPAAIEGTAAPNGGTDAAAELARIQVLLYTLPEAQHQAFVLRHWSGLSNREVAAVLATTEPAVESLLVRARSALMAAAAPGQECAAVCARLADDRPTSPADTGHIAGCRGCRTAKQRLSRAADIAAAAMLLPNVHVAHALAAAVPGFSAGAAVGASGGTVATAAGSKAGTVALLAKTGAAVVAVTAATAVGIHAHRWMQVPPAAPPAHAAVAHTHVASPSTTGPGAATAPVVASSPPAQAGAHGGTDSTRSGNGETAAAKDGHDGSASGGGTTSGGDGNSGTGGTVTTSGGDGSGSGSGGPDGGGMGSSSGQSGDGGGSGGSSDGGGSGGSGSGGDSGGQSGSAGGDG